MCGVIGVLAAIPPSPNWAAMQAYSGLLTLQHRGQDAAGILAYDFFQRKFVLEKDSGLVAQVFDAQKLERMVGQMSIGHNRYATVGGGAKENLQPFLVGNPRGLGLAHNGNLLNYFSVRTHLEKSGVNFLTDNDLEVMQHYLCTAISEDPTRPRESLFHGLKKMGRELIGGYAVVGTLAGEGLFGFRDPNGIRPLVLGKKMLDNNSLAYCLASETVALNFLGFELVRDVNPGEIVFIDQQGQLTSSEIHSTSQKKTSYPCAFEWIYFSSAEGRFDGESIYNARLRLGEALARKLAPLVESGEIHADTVVPVPDTSRTAAIRLAEVLKIPYREGLIKNRYVYRSFILDNQEKRERAVELKLSPVMSEIKNKNILLIDDSLVRGTTSKNIVSLLKKYQAKSITLALTAPPIKHGCYYGIDFPNEEKLMAYKQPNLKLMALELGVEKVVFLDLDDLLWAFNKESLCTGCFSGNYPTKIDEAKEFAKMR